MGQSGMANSLIILSILLPTTMAGLVDMFKPLLDTLDKINIQKPNNVQLQRSQQRRKPAVQNINEEAEKEERLVNMVINIQKMVKQILANQENTHQDHHHHINHDDHNNYDHHIHLRQIPTQPPLIQHVPHQQNLSPHYAEGETVRRTGFVRWPEEQEDDNNTNNFVDWEDFAIEYAALNNINNNIGDEPTIVIDDDDSASGKEYILSAPNESPNNVIGPQILHQEESLTINKFFR